MKFFLDRNISHKIVEILHNSGFESIQHNSVFAPTTEDPEIIEYVAKNDYILVTSDRRIAHLHKATLKEFSPRVVYLTAAIGRQKILLQIEWYQKIWGKVYRYLDAHEQDRQVRVDVNGNVQPYPEKPSKSKSSSRPAR